MANPVAKAIPSPCTAAERLPPALRPRVRIPMSPADSPKSRYLTAINERVVIFDGAAGTNLQTIGLTADDFGGPTLEGCNEMLVVTRPDVVANLHDSFLRVGKRWLSSRSAN